MAGAMGLQHADTFALLQQMDGRRQTGDTGANHTHIHLDLARERGAIWPARGQLFPQTRFA